MIRLRSARFGVGSRLGVAMAAITIAAVGLSLGLAFHGIDKRVDGFARDHREATATNTAALIAKIYRQNGGWTPETLRRLDDVAESTGYEIVVSDATGRRVGAVGIPAAPSEHRQASASVVVGGRTAGRITLSPTPPKLALVDAEGRELDSSLDHFREIGIVVALLMALFAACTMTTTLVRPIRRLTDAAERLSHGDLEAQTLVGGGAEIQQLGSTFNRLARTLRREGELRRAAAADIAHELRTPTAGILSRIEAAQDGVMEDPAANLEAMHAEALRLSRLIDDVELLAEAEKPELLVAKEPLDFHDVAARRIAAFAGFFQANGIALAKRLEPARVPGDARRLEQIVDNLLSNALRYTDSGGTVTVTVSTTPGGAALTVRDTGIGIDEADLEHVFERFWRSDRSRSRSTGGSGVGLAVVRGLVDAHDGQIDVESRSGLGSTFTVTLPLCDERPAIAPEHPAPALPGAVANAA